MAINIQDAIITFLLFLQLHYEKNWSVLNSELSWFQVPKSELSSLFFLLSACLRDGLKRRLKNEDSTQTDFRFSDALICDDNIPFPQSDSEAEDENRTYTGCRELTNSRQS
jgi:hypothetical protein